MHCYVNTHNTLSQLWKGFNVLTSDHTWNPTRRPWQLCHLNRCHFSNRLKVIWIRLHTRYNSKQTVTACDIKRKLTERNKFLAKVYHMKEIRLFFLSRYFQTHWRGELVKNNIITAMWKVCVFTAHKYVCLSSFHVASSNLIHFFFFVGRKASMKR